MSKKIPVLALLACLTLCVPPPNPGPVHGQSRSQAKLVINVNLKDQSPHLVQNFGLLIQKKDSNAPDTIVSSLRVKTGSDSSVTVALLPGDYLLSSERPLIIGAKAYEWAVNVKVALGAATFVELNRENVTTNSADVVLREGRIADEADLLAVLRDGVVSVQGELRQGTGFIVDASGLILTNQNLVSNSRELRVQFDRGRKVIAKLLVEDVDKDLAVLQANLAACPSCKSLVLAEPEPRAKRTTLQGARVFTINNPIGADKILTRSTIAKVDGESTFIDMPIDPSDAGAPLFNSKGEVIGLLRFVDHRVKFDDSKKPAAPSQAGIERSGIIAIDQAVDLLAQARHAVKDATASLSTELLPTEPEDSFPTDTLRNRVDLKTFKQKSYEIEVGKYQLTMITPALKYYLLEKFRVTWERERENEAKKNKNSAPSPVPPVAYSFNSLGNWADYVSQMRPVVHLLAIPEVKPTGKSIFMSILAMAVLSPGASMVLTPPDFKFKADFQEMLLTCDGKPVIPIHRGKIELVSQLQSYRKFKNRSAYAGLYTYPIDTFDPQRCTQLSLQVASEESSDPIETRLIGQKVVQLVWTDFEPYRQKSTGRK